MSRAFLIASDATQGLEVWMKWDETAYVYELFSDPQGRGYIGCADTSEEAKTIAAAWFRESAAFHEE